MSSSDSRLPNNLNETTEFASSEVVAPAMAQPEQCLRYRCVCGTDITIETGVENVCPNCSRKINGNALRSDMSLTTSIGSWDLVGDQLSRDTTLPDPVVGKNLGHFRIDEVIGQGGMGTVYRALDTSLQRFVAVKVMRGSQSGSGSTAGRNSAGRNSAERDSDDGNLSGHLEEAIAQARLNHPNVATIYYVGRQGEEPFMAMELLPHGTLADQIEAGPLPYRVAVGHVLRVAYALQHAHDFDIIHADIKPSNLLLTPGGEVKLSDFGLARRATRSETGDRVSGTPAYLAPELLQGKALSIQSDMYALGVTLFQLLFGRYPFELSGRTIYEKLNTHQTAPVEYPMPWPNAVPIEVKAFLDTLLAKSPKGRFANYELLIDELEQLQPVSSVSAGIVLRLLSFQLDQFVIAAAIVGFAAIANSLFRNVSESLSQWLILAGSVIIVAGILWWVRKGRKTPGRAAFQLRTVDDHGLPLTPAQRVARESIRSAAVFAFALAPVFEFAFVWIISAVSIVIVLGNFLSMVFTSGERAMHDVIVDSRCTLETIRRQRTVRKPIASTTLTEPK